MKKSVRILFEQKMKEREVRMVNEKRNGRVRRTGKDLFLKLIFSRAMISILLLLLQIILLFATFRWMGRYWQGFLAGCTALSVILVVYIINSDENPAFKLAWMIPLCAFPIFGVASYLFVKTNPGTHQMKERLKKLKKDTEKYLRPDREVLETLEKENSPVRDLSHYLLDYDHMPTYRDTDVHYFPEGEQFFLDVLQQLKRAEKFIFLEYFIIDNGRMWDSILEILEQKVKQGVEVRVMYDGMCSLFKLPYRYADRLQEKGIRARVFSRVIPLLSSHQNSRDHRKILVIDGKTAYTGGVNLADEYINEIELFGHWKDTAIRLDGAAVKSFTMMFLQMWNVSSGEKESYGKYLANSIKVRNTSGYVIPYNDDSINDEYVAEGVYLNIISKAKRYVHITTPYLILDYEMENALRFAAKRGVDVKLILPHIPDKKIPFMIARSHYESLLQAGVKIYEYEPGFIHAKSFVSDDDRAVVGSINLDFRSLFEHFEAAVFLYDHPVVSQIEADFAHTLGKCITVTEQYYRQIPLWQRTAGKIFRIFGSLM